MKSRYLFLACTFFIASALSAQNSSVFTLNDLFSWVKKNHPVVKQANLLPEQARFEIRAARGEFDPKLGIAFDEKDYDEKRYWSNLQGMLKVPVWIGEFKAGYDRFRGLNNSPDDFTPNSGLITAGYSLPLGAGLFIDERRNTLKQALYLKNISVAEQVSTINKILLQISIDYWDWYYAWRQLSFVNEGYTLAEVRFAAIKEMASLGSRSSLDTVDALSNLLMREVQLDQAKLNFLNSSLALSKHLWDDDGLPVELNEGVIPERMMKFSEGLPLNFIDSLKNYALQNHPDLLKIDAKLGQLGIEKRYRQEMLKPDLRINYNFLQSGSPGDPFGYLGLTNNYKFGMQFGMPLLLRKERGKLQSTKVKISLAELDQIQLKRKVEIEVKSYVNQASTMRQLQERQVEVVQAYRTMVIGEQERFLNGESSVFMVNARETNLVSAGIKLAEIEAKFAKSIAYLYWSSGLSNWNY